MKKGLLVLSLMLLPVMAYAQDTGGSETGGAMMGETGGEMMDDMMVTDGTYEVQLSGDQEVPPVMTDATGSATFTLMGDALSVTGDFENLSSMAIEVAGTPAHIHMAPMGENGPVIIPLNVTLAEDGMSGIFSVDATLTPEQTDAVMAGNLYINVHSEMHQAGELRGQLVSSMMGMDQMGMNQGMAFSDLDTDMSGSLSEDEFNVGMESGGMMGAFTDFDTDASGDISEDEYNSMSGMMNMDDSGMMGSGLMVVDPDGNMAPMAFSDLDADMSGTVDENEFNAGMEMSGGTMMGTLADFDTDMSGDLSEDEFNAMNTGMMDTGMTDTGMMGETGGAMMDGMMGMTFADFDTNGDGGIDQMEFDTAMGMMGDMSGETGGAMMDDTMGMTFADFDTDGSGIIDQMEFDAMMGMMNDNMSGDAQTVVGPDGMPLMAFADFDTDMSGTIDEDEFNAGMEMSGGTMGGAFTDFDTDASGDLSEDEFNAMNQP